MEPGARLSLSPARGSYTSFPTQKENPMNEFDQGPDDEQEPQHAAPEEPTFETTSPEPGVEVTTVSEPAEEVEGVTTGEPTAEVKQYEENPVYRGSLQNEGEGVVDGVVATDPPAESFSQE